MNDIILNAFADELEKVARHPFLAIPSAGRMGRAALIGSALGLPTAAAGAALAGAGAYRAGAGGDFLRGQADDLGETSSMYDQGIDAINAAKARLQASGVPLDSPEMNQLRQLGGDAGRYAVQIRGAESGARRAAQAADVRRLFNSSPIAGYMSDDSGEVSG
jgi:hypothetical protein